MGVKKQAFLNTFGNMVYLVTLWLLTVITTQLLGYEAVGNLTLAMAIGNIIVLFQSYGVRGFQASDITFVYSPDVYFRSRLITVIIGVLLGIVISFLLGYSVEIVATILLFIVFKSSEAVSDSFFGDIQRLGKLELVGYSMCLRGILTGLLFYTGSFFYRSLNISLLFIAVGGVLLTILLDSFLHKKIVKSYRGGTSGKVSAVLKECFPLLLTMLFPTIIIAFPRVVLAQLFGTELLGYYGNISAPALLFSTLIPSILTVLFPNYGKLVHSGDYRGLIKIWIKTLLGAVLLSLICMICVFVWGKPVLTFVYTNQILPYVHYLYYIIFAMALYAIGICNATVLVAMRENKILAFTFKKKI